MGAGAVAFAFAVTAEIRLRICESDFRAAVDRWEAHQPPAGSPEARLEQILESRDGIDEDPAPVNDCRREPF